MEIINHINGNNLLVAIVGGIIVVILTKIIFKDDKNKPIIINNNTYNMNTINNQDSPGSINTIGQQGNNTINNIALGNRPRIIDDGFKNDLLNELKKLLSEKERNVVVGIVNGADGETLNLYNQIKSFLTDNNIPVKDGMTTFYPSDPVFGVKINITNPDKIALMVGPKEI